MGEHATFLLVFSVLATVLADRSFDVMMERSTRSFPYSMPYIRMLRPQAGQGISVASIPDAFENYEIARELADLVNRIDEQESLSRQRRDDAPVLFKRYACRFKFCRIFDA